MTKIFNRNGFPWPSATPLFHATAATKNILYEGFKTREQGTRAALGGSWTKSISFTLSLPRAASIAIGLETLIRGMTRNISCVELLECLYREAPVATEMGIVHGFSLQNVTLQYTNIRDRFHYLAQVLSYLDRGWTFLTCFDSAPEVTKKGLKVGTNSWVIPSKELSRKKIPDCYTVDYKTAFYNLYRSVLSFGRIEKEAFNPIWTLTDLDSLEEKKYTDVSVLICATSIPRICVDTAGAIRLGFISKKVVDGRFRYLLDRAHSLCRVALSERGDDYINADLDVYWEDNLDGWLINNRGQRLRSDTMLFSNSEEEVIIYDTASIAVQDYMTVPDIRHYFSLDDRVTFPWFDDDEIDVRI